MDAFESSHLRAFIVQYSELSCELLRGLLRGLTLHLAITKRSTIPLQYEWYSYNTPPQNNKAQLILKRSILQIYAILMLIVYPVEESGGDFFRPGFCPFSNNWNL